MKTKDLIKALHNLNPEAEVKILIKQSNKLYGVPLSIKYGSGDENPEDVKEGEYSHILNTWVNNSYGGSTVVHLPKGAYIAGLPEHMKPVY